MLRYLETYGAVFDASACGAAVAVRAKRRAERTVADVNFMMRMSVLGSKDDCEVR